MNQPILSIVICTYNRDTYLQKCLDHLSIQTAPKDVFEVLVINNNSSDQTEKICSDFSKNHQELQFRHLVEREQGLSYSRNLGVRQSKGEILSYIDDDAFADHKFVSNLIGYFHKHHDADAIGGKITPVYEGSAPRWMSKYLLPLVAALDMGNKPRVFKGRKFPIGANMAFRRRVFDQAGLFHTDLGRKGEFLGSGEEKEFFYRLKKQNMCIHYVPDIHVHHSIPDRRLQSDYIKKMAVGIGKSEALRLRQGSADQYIIGWVQEFLKIGATIILAIIYFLQGDLSKASMLFKFRLWFLGSFLKSSNK